MTDRELEKLQALELKIAGEVRRICEKHGIRYFLIAGSALGAVRHQGFIPWDEDMDFGMVRPEYERFLAACREELDPSVYFLQTMETDPGYAFAFAKIRLCGTKIVETFSRDARCRQGIYVDIFPFDLIPDDPAARNRQRRARLIAKLLYASKLGYRAGGGKNAVIRGGIRALAAVLPRGFLLSAKKKAYAMYRDANGRDMVTAEGSYGYTREIISASYTEELVPMPFGTETFPVFARYDEYLRGMYGDYMTPLPPEAREKHEIEEVSFGDFFAPESR